MPKVRGKYKQYLYDENIKIPDRTKRQHRAQQKIINQSSENIYEKENEVLENNNCVEYSETRQIPVVNNSQESINFSDEMLNNIQFNNESTPLAVIFLNW
jgi:hypothetical protein